MSSNNKNYNFLVIILFLAIAISLAFHIFFRQDLDDGFSEIYFPFPDNLPNKVQLDENYDFSFSIRNLEAKPSTYEYNAKLELFNLYDVTEGIYKCAAKQRKKVNLKFAEGNESNSGKYLLNSALGNSGFIYSESDNYGMIGWENYNIQYKYRNALNTGSFTTIFHDENNTKYSFTIYDDASEVEFAYRDNGSIKRQRKRISNLKSENDVFINVSDGIKYYINEELIFSKNLDDITNGKIDFRMDSTYILINGLIAYRDSPIEVTHPEYIRDYNINSNLISKKITELRKKSEEDVHLLRTETDLNAVCESEACNELKLYLNNPQNTYSFGTGLEGDGKLLISLIEPDENQNFPSQAYLQNSTASELFWTDFTLKLDFQTFVQPHTFLIILDKNFMILFHCSDVYFIINDNGMTEMHRRASPVKVGVNELFLESKNTNIIVKINRMPIFNFKGNMHFKDISLYTKKSFISFGDIILTSREENCNSLAASIKCRQVYRIQSLRDVSQGSSMQVVSGPAKFSDEFWAIPFLGVYTLFENAADENSINDSLMRSLDYDIEVDPSLINEDIPSEKYLFDGRDAVLKGMQNYSFSFDFNALEGIGLLEASFHNIDGEKTAIFIFNQAGNEAYLFTNFNGEWLKDTVNVGKSDAHKLDIIYEDNRINYYFDWKKIFELGEVNMSNGFFSISTFNSHFDIKGMSLYDRSTKRRVPFLINADPCRLRKIKEILLDKNSLFLADGEMETINRSFNIEDDFDYGMLSVFLMQQEKESTSEIHFWVVSDE